MEANSSSSSYHARQQMPHYSAALHSVRRHAAAPPPKAWKKPTAPPVPAPPRVYKVDPIDFRDLVQKLTAAPGFLAGNATQRSAHVPPPVELPAKPSSLSVVYREFSDVLVEDQKVSLLHRPGQSGGFLGLNLSPPVNTASSPNWCSYAMLSPGTLSSLEQSSVL